MEKALHCPACSWPATKAVGFQKKKGNRTERGRRYWRELRKPGVLPATGAHRRPMERRMLVPHRKVRVQMTAWGWRVRCHKQVVRRWVARRKELPQEHPSKEFATGE